MESFIGRAVAHIYSECGHIHQYDVLERCVKYSWWTQCDAWDEHIMPKQKVINRPYCRECFSKRRRKIAQGFIKLEEEITSNGVKEGLAPKQIEEIKAEVRQKLADRLEHFDREYLGKGNSTVRVV